MKLKGAIAAVDFGERRIGVARCDPTRTIVTPLTVIERKNHSADRAKLNEVISAQEAVLILVGVPLNPDGTEGPQAKKMKEAAEGLLSGRPEPIVYWDEHLTTFAAEQLRRGHKGGAAEDALAAAVILEDYLRTTGDLA